MKGGGLLATGSSSCIIKPNISCKGNSKKMRLGYYIYFIALLGLFSQDGAIQGIVKDKSGNPLWGSNVYLLGTSLGSSTDSSGSYRIENIPVDK